MISRALFFLAEPIVFKTACRSPPPRFCKSPICKPPLVPLGCNFFVTNYKEWYFSLPESHRRELYRLNVSIVCEGKPWASLWENTTSLLFLKSQGREKGVSWESRAELVQRGLHRRAEEASWGDGVRRGGGWAPLANQWSEKKRAISMVRPGQEKATTWAGKVQNC